MQDPDIDALLRRGEIDQAAALARRRGYHRRAAELLALGGRHVEGVTVAFEAGEWRLALDLAFASGDPRIVAALGDELGRDAGRAAAAAAQARVARRPDIAARILEATAPAEAGAAWYEVGEYLYAARAFERAGSTPQAVRALEQHLAQTPDDATSAEKLADLRARRGDDEGAVRALQAAARVGDRPEVLRKLIDGLMRIGFPAGALAVARRLRSLVPDASLEPRDFDGALPRSDGAESRYAGRYRVVREVGSGATGRVMQAVDELTGEAVALKVLSVGNDRGGAFARFMREADLARVLEDPTLVRMRALDPEGPTIVYDWMPGGTLADRIGVLVVPEIRAIALRLLTALETLHRHGVVHRDLKPSNVLFDPAGQARLGDLGAAHLGDLGATVTGGLVGSLPYMAPEQITGAPVSAATDLYAFGCVLFQMLTGRLPFPGPDFVTQHVAEPVPRVSAARPALGDAYDLALESLLAKDPLVRPQDVAAARGLLAALPWQQPDDAARAAPTRISSIPIVAAEEGARLVPSVVAGRWTDSRLGRDVELVRVERSERDALTRWAGAGQSELQAVYELVEDGDALVAWVQPLDGEPRALDDVGAPARARILGALASAGVAPALLPRARLVESDAMGIQALVRGLFGGT